MKIVIIDKNRDDYGETYEWGEDIFSTRVQEGSPMVIGVTKKKNMKKELITEGFQCIILPDFDLNNCAITNIEDKKTFVKAAELTGKKWPSNRRGEKWTLNHSESYEECWYNPAIIFNEKHLLYGDHLHEPIPTIDAKEYIKIKEALNYRKLRKKDKIFKIEDVWDGEVEEDNLAKKLKKILGKPLLSCTYERHPPQKKEDSKMIEIVLEKPKDNQIITIADLIEKNACKDWLLWLLRNKPSETKFNREYLIDFLDKNFRQEDSDWINENFPKTENNEKIKTIDEIDLEKLDPSKIIIIYQKEIKRVFTVAFDKGESRDYLNIKVVSVNGHKEILQPRYDSKKTAIADFLKNDERYKVLLFSGLHSFCEWYIRV